MSLCAAGIRGGGLLRIFLGYLSGTPGRSPRLSAELLRLAFLPDSTQEIQYSRQPDHQHYLADCETFLALGGG